jgi:hypothetical protein
MDQSYQKASLEKNQNTPDQQDGGGTGKRGTSQDSENSREHDYSESSK